MPVMGKGRAKSQAAWKQIKIKSQAGFLGTCSIKLKVHCWRCVFVCQVCERELCEAFSLDLPMLNPISLWLLPSNITLTARNGQREI